MSNAEYHRNYYHKNKEKISAAKRERSKNQYLKLRNFSDRVKLRFGCCDCGYKVNPRALQFDHRGDKKSNVSDMLRDYVSLEKLKSEMRKCDIRCANCHAVKTHS